MWVCPFFKKYVMLRLALVNVDTASLYFVDFFNITKKITYVKKGNTRKIKELNNFHLKT